MINYSIYIAGSKPGTKKADIKETKAYGTSQIHEALSFDDFCQHIADHNSPFSAGAICGILKDAVACLREQLLAGNSVQFGDMGRFHVELNTVGAAALINWLLSEEGQNLAANYGFEQYGEYLFYLKDGRPVSTAEIPAATEETKKIRLSTTTSVNDSGLLGYLLPIFEEKYGYEVEVYSAGTGKSIANAKMGNADLILVHSKKQEEAFIADGFSYVIDGMESERLNYMYNYFVLCGPSADPAGVKDAADVKAAFQAIADGKYTFISRGDGSGTHTKELSLWPEELGITAEAESFKDYTDWYVSANTGMGACLVMAEEMGAYILTDKATFLTFVANDGVMG